MTLRGLHVASHILSRLPTVGVFAKATPQDTPKAVVTKTDEPMRRFVIARSFSSKKRSYQSTFSVSEEKAGGVQPAGGSQPELKVTLAMINDYLEINFTSKVSYCYDNDLLCSGGGGLRKGSYLLFERKQGDNRNNDCQN